MLKWLIKFTLEVAPPVAATLIGAFLVHQLWPSQQPEVRPPATPAVAQSPAEPAKATEASNEPAKAGPSAVSFGSNSDPQPAASVATSGRSVRAKASRQSSEVAKTSPAASPPAATGGETAAAVLERAEKALATIPSSKSTASSNSAAAVSATTVAPAPAVPPPPAPASTVTATANIPASSVALPPMDPPREISAPVQAAAPPVAAAMPAHPENRSPLRVYHRDRANLAEIPNVENGPVPGQEASAAPTEPQPSSPPREKNIVEHFFGSIQSVLPERLRAPPN
jgi:hypothetical protein